MAHPCKAAVVPALKTCGAVAWRRLCCKAAAPSRRCSAVCQCKALPKKQGQQSTAVQHYRAPLAALHRRSCLAMLWTVLLCCTVQRLLAASSCMCHVAIVLMQHYSAACSTVAPPQRASPPCRSSCPGSTCHSQKAWPQVPPSSCPAGAAKCHSPAVRPAARCLWTAPLSKWAQRQYAAVSAPLAGGGHLPVSQHPLQQQRGHQHEVGSQVLVLMHFRPEVMHSNLRAAGCSCLSNHISSGEDLRTRGYLGCNASWRLGCTFGLAKVERACWAYTQQLWELPAQQQTGGHLWIGCVCIMHAFGYRAKGQLRSLSSLRRCIV